MIKKARPVRSSLALEKVRQRFARWRQGSEPRARIPERLWAAAVERARQSGLNRTARALHLDYYSLKKRLEVGDGDGKTRRRRSASGQRVGGGGSTRQAFVEVPTLDLVARPALAPFMPMDSVGAECHLIVDSSAGARLTVILARADTSVIDAVCRSVLGGLPAVEPTAT